MDHWTIYDWLLCFNCIWIIIFIAIIWYLILSNSQTPDGLIDIIEFKQALGIKNLGFAKRIFSAFDIDGSNQIDFEEFLIGMSSLSPRSSIEQKAKFCFKVFDIDGNGTIDKDELKEVLTYSILENQSVNLSENHMNIIIDGTFRQMNCLDTIPLDKFVEESKKNPSILNCVNCDLSSIWNW